ncbi:YraN family protein [Brevibacillus sp. HB1.2]|uniref:YraN family protein n=1 Tax=Brevibacillus TaxID=55080 RepID=UPI000366CC7A|nr:MULTISPECIES: YraN family protein [unclassified Brevibacillus]ATF14208.1 YraN family protein [Brevibacillus brevis X23]NRS15883.1 YraN family protein [Brevibacillus sp. HB1.4B]NTU19803.1 YraN family protein [Brevibacillus sp. HB1.2]NTU29044.1 YraN family protein [Brevibacillus sp. HB1.1]
MSDRRRLLGQKGEQLAESYLVNKGFCIVDRNVRTKRGEMDLIALDGNCLVFIEVRTRSSQSFGSAGESITWKKKQKLRELAIEYLQKNSQPIPAFRFDVIAIYTGTLTPGGDFMKPVIEHYESAF